MAVSTATAARFGRRPHHDNPAHLLDPADPLKVCWYPSGWRCFWWSGLLLMSVILPPLDTPVHALKAPVLEGSYAPGSVAISGTVASFAALFPNLVTITDLPLISRASGTGHAAFTHPARIISFQFCHHFAE